MKSFAAALILATAQAIGVQGGYDEYEHTHTEYGEATEFRDVEVIYEEVDYSI